MDYVNTVKAYHIRACANELKDMCFLAPNNIVLAAVINSDQDLVGMLNRYYGPEATLLDTAERELLLDALVQFYLGEGRYWPCNGDDGAEVKTFVADLTSAITKAGWQLLD